MVATDLVAPLAAAPRRSALFFDLDGTLAPIARRPELAAVPERTRAALARLARRFLLVACVSGRPSAEAAQLVGVDGVRYVGNHGLELHPRAPELARELAAAKEAIGDAWPVEDKGLSLSLHFRDAPDERAARAVLAPIAERARALGLDAFWGRKVLEIRPRADANKGTAVAALVRECGAELALYVGDDTTDLDAFRSLAGLGLEYALRVAIASPEANPELVAEADLVLDGPDAVVELMDALLVG